MITKKSPQKYKCVAFATKFLTEGQSGRMQNQRFFHHGTFFNHVNIFDVVVCLLKIAEFKLNIWQ